MIPVPQYTRSVQLVIMLSLLNLLISGSAFAEVFQYTDSNGTLVFVDEAGKVPVHYRSRTTVRPADKAPESRATRSGVIVSDNKVYLTVTVRHRGKTVNCRFLLDTGASVTIISESLAEKLGIPTEETTQGLTRVADGRNIQSRRTTLDTLTVGPKTLHDIDVGILRVTGPPLPFEGWLGMNFLGQFRHQLDVNTQTILWSE